jgi:hypothetical protein
MEAECRYCANLMPHLDPSPYMLDDEGIPPWRCPFGRFDLQHEGQPFKRWFAWLVIWFSLDPAIKKAQKDCPRFQVHPQAGKFTDTWREMP